MGYRDRDYAHQPADVVIGPDGYVREVAGQMDTTRRMGFLRRVYGWFGLGVAVSAAVATPLALYLMQNTATLISVFQNWWMVFIAMMALGFVFQRMTLQRETAVAGLVLYAIMQGVIFAPLIALAFYAAGGSFVLVWQALLITGITFGGLTGYVLLTKQDFSFMRGALVVISLVFFGVIISALVFGTSMGSPFALAICGFGVLLGAGYVLYDTSLIVNRFGDGDEVMAGAALHADFALMLWYVLQILISLAGRDG